ncbi:unnamed protein product [Mytilus edulis]|uniref:Histone-lysine N-methyltransferase SETMAR n=1 Tax=Mytilus edulis TaxID=6550 RepID=A0A8S3PRP1_MYTED|nr:unnamed protein product [Mytilus edulis]
MLVVHWYSSGRKGLEDRQGNFEDNEREGMPSFRESDAIKDEVLNVINSDRQQAVADKCDISKTTAHHFIANDLNINRLCARWVPRLLTAEYFKTKKNGIVLRRYLVQALRKKHPYLAANIDQVILHQDNAPGHTSLKTSLEIDLLGFECQKHPPYGPELALMGFTVFPHFKSFLNGQWFDDLPEL